MQRCIPKFNFNNLLLSILYTTSVSLGRNRRFLSSVRGRAQECVTFSQDRINSLPGLEPIEVQKALIVLTIFMYQ